MLLDSINWEEVGLLSSSHFLQETDYAESVATWVLQSLSDCGIVQLQQDDLKITFAGTQVAVQLNACQAVLPEGIVDLRQSRGALSLKDSLPTDGVEERLFTVHLSREAKKTPVKAPVDANAPIRSDKVRIPLLQAEYKLFLSPAIPDSATESQTAAYDDPVTFVSETETVATFGLVIARIKNDGTGLREDTNFIPPCLFLKSHWRLIKAVQEIRKWASGCYEKSKSHTMVPHLMPLLVPSLFPLIDIRDWNMHPRAYVERCLIMLHTHDRFLPSGPMQGKTRMDETLKKMLRLAPPGPDAAIATGEVLELVLATLKDLHNFYSAQRKDG